MSPTRPLRNPPSPDPLAGTRYRTVGILGRGGMGEILDAEHCDLGRRVAVKLLHRHLVTPDAIERFRIEAEALARLSDPHLVFVTDCGETGTGVPYFVMERLDGRTLRQELIRRGPLPLDEAVALFSEVLAGLDVLHAAGIVHRDLKPGNIFLCEGPRGARSVKLLDLGIAKILAGDPARIGIRGPSHVLTQGMAIGTPQYMAPEQARGGSVDARADLYAAGLVFFRMIAGKHPFEECRDFASLFAAQELPMPAPSSFRQGIPPAMDAVVLRAVAFDPADRFGSAGELGDALRGQSPSSTERLIDESPPTVRAGSVHSLRTTWPRLLLAGSGAAAISALITLAILLLAAR